MRDKHIINPFKIYIFINDPISNIVTFFIYSKVHPCMDIILLHFSFFLKYIHAWTTKMNVDNLNARHKPALFTTKLEIHGFF